MGLGTSDATHKIHSCTYVIIPHCKDIFYAIPKRCPMRKKTLTLKKVSLHDTNHHSFIFGLTGDALLKMMTSMTAQHYFEIHGTYPPRLDKTKMTVRHMKA